MYPTKCSLLVLMLFALAPLATAHSMCNGSRTKSCANITNHHRCSTHYTKWTHCLHGNKVDTYYQCYWLYGTCREIIPAPRHCTLTTANDESTPQMQKIKSCDKIKKE